MSKFIEIPVTSEDNLVLNADMVVTCIRASSTTTDIILSGGTGTVTAGQNLQLTHAADGAAASVAKTIMDAIKTINRQGRAPDVSYVMTPATAVSAVAIA